MESENLESISSKVKQQQKITKKSRLIVRNLSFQVTEEKFRKYFSSCGEIQEVNILKKPNGKLVGCAFIQYTRVPQAAKALRELNLKPFMGRPIAIDWALPKEKFQGKSKDAKAQIDVKEEAEDVVSAKAVEIKEEPLDDIEIKDEKDDELQNSKKSLKRERDDESDSESDRSSNSIHKDKIIHKRSRITENDADEGRTLFLRNLEFETTPEKLKEFFEVYGTLCYAVLCKDRLTEHPKGTAFVKFQRSEDMAECLSKFESDPSHFIIGRRQFFISEALSKTKLGEKLETGTNKQPNDKRNLFLAREGFIRPETEAATGLSLNDNNKRTLLHRTKRQMLKDLNIFVSDVRLCVHNLPPQFTDKNLRKLFIKYGGKGVHLTEAKVMRDMNDMDLNGVGKSKEFGFVKFTKHENALQALRVINNNPTIFTPKKRPIVEFSLENRKALRAKEKRAENSRDKNKNTEKLTCSSKDGSSNSDIKGKKKKKKLFAEAGVEESRAKKSRPRQPESHEVLPKYSGLTAKFGVSTLPSLKAKGKITRKNLKPFKHQKKKSQQLGRRMKEPKSRPQVKMSREDQVDKLVNRYKQRTMGEQKSSTSTKKRKTKWFK